MTLGRTRDRSQDCFGCESAPSRSFVYYGLLRGTGLGSWPLEELQLLGIK